MDNELKAAAWLSGILFTMGAIGHLQHHPLPVGDIRGGLSRFNRWVKGASGEVLSCLVIIGGFVVLFVNWGWY